VLDASLADVPAETRYRVAELRHPTAKAATQGRSARIDDEP